MALFKRKSTPQFVVGLASWGLPRPIRWIFGTRIISRLLLILVPLLITIGVLTLDWSNGWPRLSVNRERASQVGQTATELAEKIRNRVPESVAEKVRERIPERLSLDRWPSEAPTSQQASAVSSREPNGVPITSRAAASTIRIASFNIQVFGTSKASKPEVMQVLADVVRRFDIVAIQELRTMDPSVMEGFLTLINAEGASYRYLIGPRLGRTISKEQYVFVYDSTRIDADPQSLMTVADPQDHLHREPTFARFQVRSDSRQPGFSFILANIHTDPDETDTELDALDDVFVSLQRNGWGEDDVILLGDFNVSYREFGELGQLPNIAFTVRDEPTNTRGTKSYDNIVFDRLATSEFTGVSGILNLQQEFRLSMDQALAVSDHLPVWAEFDRYEHGVQVPVAVRSGDVPIRRGQGRVVENPLLRQSRRGTP